MDRKPNIPYPNPIFPYMRQIIRNILKCTPDECRTYTSTTHAYNYHGYRENPNTCTAAIGVAATGARRER